MKKRQRTKRLLCFILSMAMLMTTGAFDGMAGVVKIAGAESATLTLAEPMLNEYSVDSNGKLQLGGQITASDLTGSSLTNTISKDNAIIHMDVKSALTFTVTSEGDWNAYLVDSNNNRIGKDGVYVTSKTDYDPTYASSGISYTDVKVALIASDRTEENGVVTSKLTITTEKEVNADKEFYLYIYCASNTAAYIKARIFIYNPVESIDMISANQSMVAGKNQTMEVKKDNITTRNESKETTDKYRWSVTSNVAGTTIDPETGVLTAGSTPGNATVTVKAVHGLTKSGNNILALRDRKVSASRDIDIQQAYPVTQIYFKPNAGDESGDEVVYNMSYAQGTMSLQDKLQTVTESGETTTDTFSWESSDTSVATVASDGKVTAKKVGSVRITATVDGTSGKYATCIVNVNINADSLTVSREGTSDDKITQLSLRSGSEVVLKVTESSNSSQTPNEYLVASSDSDFISVSEGSGTGNVRYFTVKVKDGITSTKTEQIVRIRTDRTSANKDEQVNNLEQTISFSLYPSISDDRVITLSHEGVKLTEDTVNVYYGGNTVADSLQSIEDVMGELDADLSSVYFEKSAEREALDKTFEKLLGAAYKLTATANVPETEPGEQFKWNFSGTNADLVSYIAVADYIYIIPKGTGTLTLKAVAKSNPNVTKEITLNIKKQADSIRIEENALNLNVGESYTLTAVQSPDEAEEKVLWNSNHEDKVSVDANGKVTVKEMSDVPVTITATTEHTGKTANCTINIYQAQTAAIYRNTENLSEMGNGYSVEYGTADFSVKTVVTDPNGATVNNPNVVWSLIDSASEAISLEKTSASQAMVHINKVGSQTIKANCGEKSATATINVDPRDVSKISIPKIENQKYTGSAIKPELILTDLGETLQEGTDYTLEYEDNVNASTEAKIILTGKGNYTGTKEIKFTITAVSLEEDITASDIPTQNYAATFLVPGLTMTYNGMTLVEGVDYNIVYTNNFNVGEATATITGQGNYKGTITKNFRIEQKTSFQNPATDVIITADGDAAMVGDHFYVNVKETSTYNIELTSSSGTCDDIVYSTISAGDDKNQMFSAVTVVEDGGSKAKLNIIGTKPGTQYIYLNTMSGNLQKMISVTVYQPATDMKIMASSDGKKETDITGIQFNMIENHTLQLSAKFTPTDSTDKVVWSVSDPSIATIDAEGIVTSIKPGTVQVTAGIADNETGSNPLTVTTMLTITQNTPATSISLDKDALVLKAKDKAVLTATTLPANNTEQLVWKSSDEKVATVTQAGEVVAVADGTATITCSNFLGTITATCLVTVCTPATALKLDKTEGTIKKQETITLTANLEPEAALDTFQWISSDPDVAKVEMDAATAPANKSTAKVTGLKAGTCTIFVKAKGKGFEAKCTITVTDSVYVAGGLGKVSLSKVKNAKKKSMTVSWKKLKGAEGYQVAYATKKNFKGAKKKLTTKTSITIKKLKKKKTYYVRVRAYQTASAGKEYGKWSAVKKVKIKK